MSHYMTDEERRELALMVAADNALAEIEAAHRELDEAGNAGDRSMPLAQRVKLLHEWGCDQICVHDPW